MQSAAPAKLSKENAQKNYLDEAEHVREGLVLLRRELEAHLGVLLLPEHGAGEVLLHERDHL